MPPKYLDTRGGTDRTVHDIANNRFNCRHGLTHLRQSRHSSINVSPRRDGPPYCHEASDLWSSQAKLDETGRDNVLAHERGDLMHLGLVPFPVATLPPIRHWWRNGAQSVDCIL